MGYLKVPTVCPLLQWLSSLSANLLHISTIDINKLLLISLEIRCGVIMQWRSITKMCKKPQDTLWGILIMKLVYIKWLPRITTIEVEGEITVMKCMYLLEHVVAESGKTWRSLVHMQLKFFKVCTSMQPAILTHVTVWTTSFTSFCGAKVRVIVEGRSRTTVVTWPTPVVGQRLSCEVKNKEWNGWGTARKGKTEGRSGFEGDSTKVAMRSVSSRGA